MQEITFHVDKKTHGRYRNLSKAIKAKGMNVNKTIPNFLVDKLEEDKKNGFENLKKYI